MMKILPGRRANSLDEATLLVLREAGKGELSPDVTTVFTSVIDADKLEAEAERGINTAVHGRYGRGARWRGRQWFVAMPQPRYDAQPIPRVTFAVQVYLVAPITVETADNYYRAAVVGPAGKTEKLTLPICFLQAILDDDLEQFELVGKDSKHSSWSIPGLKEALRLPNDFVAKLSAVLWLKSVSSWLLGFGPDGEAVAPLVVGNLLGLQFSTTTTALPIGEQPFQRETIIDTLNGMFGSARAAEMFQRWALYLKPGMTNEEAVSFIVQEEGRRF